MNDTYKPNGYSSLSPYLTVDGAVSVKKGNENKRAGVKNAGGTIWWIVTKVE